jgi:lipopolysaccharide export system protein LptA
VKGLKTLLRSMQTLVLCVAALPIALFCACAPVRGDTETRARSGREAISISATFAQSWQEDRETVHLLRGQCQIVQGGTTIRAEQMVVWRRPASQNAARERVSVYLEEDVRIDEPGNTITERTLMLDLVTDGGVKLQAKRPITGQPGHHDPTYQHAVARRGAARKGSLRQVQHLPTEGEPESEIRNVELKPPPGGIRRVRTFPRSGGDLFIESHRSENTTPPEQVVTISGGVNLLIDAAEQRPGVPSPIGTIDLSADRAVIWTDAAAMDNFTGEVVQPNEMPLQIYLEGHIVVRQGRNTLKATQAFYDVREERALLIESEIRARIPGFPTDVRVRAQTLRQTGHDTFHGQQAFITTSPFAEPGYRLQISDIFLEPRFDDPWIGVQGPQFDPETGEPIGESTLWATTLNNTFFVENVPIFYFPYLSAPAEDPNIPLRNLQFHSDRIFGQAVYTSWDVNKLFGIDRIPGTRWNLDLNYLSYRGPQIGTNGTWRGVGRFGLDGPFQGQGYASFIYDGGNDNLGLDRIDLNPAQHARGGLNVRDRQDLPQGMVLQSELSFLSDRNWLEQYREREFDTGKDYETLLYLRQNLDNWGWSVQGRPRLYNYYNTTQWLPRGDLFGLAEPLFGGLLTWSSHTYAGYAQQRIADQPTDPQDLYTVLPFEGNGQGLVAATRHEIDMPFQLGALHVVPYALGEEAFWGSAFHNIDSPTPVDGRIFGSTQVNEGSLNRLYGSLGARASLEMWKTFPEVQSDVFNLHGLAHKMVFDADYSFSTSNQALGLVPQYNEFDDNAQEQFRRRLLVNTYDGTLPPQFEPRFFAVRSGAATGVTTPYNELVDNMNVLRLGWRHRLQTKVGPINAPRIKNWMTLDLETSLFPDYNRDNFGQLFGLYGARYNWYMGDRTTLTAGALLDSFSNHETLWNVGLISQRTARGTVYVGVRDIQGPPLLHTEILTASYSYVMSPKWISSVGTAYDLAERQNRGQTVQITRVGADFLIHFGTLIDPTKNNFGIAISIEPRFAPFTGTSGPAGQSTQLGSLLYGTPGMGMGPAR